VQRGWRTQRGVGKGEKVRTGGGKCFLAMAEVDVEVAVAMGTLRFPCFWLVDLYLVGTWLRGGRYCVGAVAVGRSRGGKGRAGLVEEG
jgi:hypothetical protein